MLRGGRGGGGGGEGVESPRIVLIINWPLIKRVHSLVLSQLFHGGTL